MADCLILWGGKRLSVVECRVAKCSGSRMSEWQNVVGSRMLSGKMLLVAECPIFPKCQNVVYSDVGKSLFYG